MWVIEDGQLTNTKFIEALPKPMAKPYPAALWRIDSTVNGGMPYHELLSDIEIIDNIPPVYIGSTRIKEIIYGSKPITAIYYGKQKIY